MALAAQVNLMRICLELVKLNIFFFFFPSGNKSLVYFWELSNARTAVWHLLDSSQSQQVLLISDGLEVRCGATPILGGATTACMSSCVDKNVQR